MACFEAKKRLLEQAKLLRNAFVVTAQEPLPDALVTAVQVSCHTLHIAATLLCATSGHKSGAAVPTAWCRSTMMHGGVCHRCTVLIAH